MKRLPWFFYTVDFGFIAYWLITAIGVIPAEYLYNDYKNPILVAWNWSFFPIDIAVSVTGLYSMYLKKKGEAKWTSMAILSLALTSASGLMAISYWVIVRDFEWQWWLPNLFLLCYPVYFLRQFLQKEK